MDEPDFDAQGLFDEDYLHFYAEALRDERSDAETELLWRLLELRPDMEVLDLACGHGRIANRLAARGCRVTGLDATRLFLGLARRAAADRGVTVDYLQGDMRTLPWTGRFDRVVNWFTSFGYFDDAELRQVLAQVARALKPGDGSPWSCSTATGSSVRCSPPWSWSATETCSSTATGSIR